MILRDKLLVTHQRKNKFLVEIATLKNSTELITTLLGNNTGNGTDTPLIVAPKNNHGLEIGLFVLAGVAIILACCYCWRNGRKARERALLNSGSLYPGYSGTSPTPLTSANLARIGGAGNSRGTV